MVRANTLQGDTVDLLCLRHLGRTAGVTEAVYAINPGLAALGPVLPIGIPVDLPETVARAQTPLLQLWD